jgi:hypothetical protein
LPQPEGQSKHNDLIDAVITSSQSTIDIPQKDGTITKEQILNEKTIWTKLLQVASNTLGQMIFFLEEWVRAANDAPRNMCRERCADIQHDIIEVDQSFRRALDAKGSESIGVNKQNSQTTLLGMIGKNKQERVYTMKDMAKKSLMDSILGRDIEKDGEND